MMRIKINNATCTEWKYNIVVTISVHVILIDKNLHGLCS